MVCVRNGGGLMKIGDIVTKNEYTQYAIWCNKNNAHIEDKGSYYEVVENEQYIEPEPQPTEMDRLSAQAMYTALMTDTLLDMEVKDDV